MTGEYSSEQLHSAVRMERPLIDLQEHPTIWSLGGIAISKVHPWFSYGFKSSLCHDSRFRKQHFSFPDIGRSGWAIIFRAWDAGTTGQPEEFFAGWVPDERERDAERWIRFLNRELRYRLAEERERRDGER